MRAHFVGKYEVGITRQCNSSLTREELKCKSPLFLLSPPEMPHFSSLPKSRDACSIESSAMLGLRDPRGSLRPHCTIGEAFGAIFPYCGCHSISRECRTVNQCPKEGSDRLELCTGRRVHKASGICMICFNVGYFRFKMCLNYHPKLIPAT